MLTMGLLGCKKNNTKPTNPLSNYPLPTHTGANEVVWLTDSIPYISKSNLICELFGDTTPKTGAYFQIETNFVANKGYNRALLLLSPFNISLPINAGTIFSMQGGPDSNNDLFEFTGSLSPTTADLVLPSSSGQITITYFDPVKKIISGTFNFNTLAIPSTPSRKISNGWFDMTYTAY
jgi:hypothetical protein